MGPRSWLAGSSGFKGVRNRQFIDPPMPEKCRLLKTRSSWKPAIWIKRHKERLLKNYFSHFSSISDPWGYSCVPKRGVTAIGRSQSTERS
ncbi:uncharacterized protein YALI1_C17419g [Yarrowia lipolytica]|uniref:Uncharacterized protein n=1 Tax=Yarrowia lipolytica TaxID=4952 RepID=A0A1D8NAU0_YARLL|nr:hypothetical protein YALI1_C17419g [Yarrowia lipolytica]